MNLDLHEFPSIGGCAEAIAEAMGKALEEAVADRGSAGMAVSGGNTPRHIFPVLAARKMPWDKVKVTLADERWVAPDHPDSNELLARECLLQGPAAAAGFTGLKCEAPTPEEGLEETEARMGSLPWPLDVTFLGMGEDGHIASLFPGEDWDGENTGRCLAVPALGDRVARMSLSPGAILDSRRIFLVLSGDAKRQVFEAALSPGAALELPLRLLLHQDRAPLSVYAVR